MLRSAKNKHLILICGQYGVDERIIQTEVDEEWSIGDFVLGGGELPAMTLVDSVARFVPGVLGDFASAEEDSFADLLDCPHYTRPDVLDGMALPGIKSGNHQALSLANETVARPHMVKEDRLWKTSSD